MEVWSIKPDTSNYQTCTLTIERFSWPSVIIVTSVIECLVKFANFPEISSIVNQSIKKTFMFLLSRWCQQPRKMMIKDVQSYSGKFCVYPCTPRNDFPPANSWTNSLDKHRFHPISTTVNWLSDIFLLDVLIVCCKTITNKYIKIKF